MRRALVIPLLAMLVATGAAGCLGEEASREPMTVAESGGCDLSENDGTVAPGDPLTAQGEAEGAPDSASIGFAGTAHAGVIDLILERNETEVWTGTFTGIGGVDYTDQVNGLAPGMYTLTARSDAGAADGNLKLELVWGGATCA